MRKEIAKREPIRNVAPSQEVAIPNQSGLVSDSHHWTESVLRPRRELYPVTKRISKLNVVGDTGIPDIVVATIGPDVQNVGKKTYSPIFTLNFSQDADVKDLSRETAIRGGGVVDWDVNARDLWSLSTDHVRPGNEERVREQALDTIIPSGDDPTRNVQKQILREIYTTLQKVNGGVPSLDQLSASLAVLRRKDEALLQPRERNAVREAFSDNDAQVEYPYYHQLSTHLDSLIFDPGADRPRVRRQNPDAMMKLFNWHVTGPANGEVLLRTMTNAVRGNKLEGDPPVILVATGKNRQLDKSQRALIGEFTDACEKKKIRSVVTFGQADDEMAAGLVNTKDGLIIARPANDATSRSLSHAYGTRSRWVNSGRSLNGPDRSTSQAYAPKAILSEEEISGLPEGVALLMEGRKPRGRFIVPDGNDRMEKLQREFGRQRRAEERTLLVDRGAQKVSEATDKLAGRWNERDIAAETEVKTIWKR